MTAKERRALLKDLRKFGVAEWSYSFATGETKIVFAFEAPVSAPGKPSPKGRDKADHGPGPDQAPERQSDNPYQELASAVGLDWARISGQHAGETD